MTQSRLLRKISLEATLTVLMARDLYLVIRPKQHPRPTFKNDFDEQGLPTQIRTTIEIGEACKNAMDNDEKVFIHRTGMEGLHRLVICSVKIADVRKINRTTALVQFSEHVKLSRTPPKRLPEGTSFYYA
jgi:hypothetical protein